jgi:ABC-type proline/glycine betaine transport system permease subunit
VILSFLVRGWALHPIRAALVALLGAGALGTAIVHLGCGFLGPKHVLLGHLSVPVVLAVLGLYPLSVLLRRLRG